jgi:hypothetical protein
MYLIRGCYNFGCHIINQVSGFYVPSFHVTHILIRSDPVHATFPNAISTCDGVSPTTHHSLHRARKISCQNSRTLADLPDHTRRSNTRNNTVIPLQLLDFFPLHFPIFPLHLQIFPSDLVELVPSLSLVYINSAASRTHEVGKREAAFKTKITPDPSVALLVLTGADLTWGILFGAKCPSQGDELRTKNELNIIPALSSDRLQMSQDHAISHPIRLQ